ncbi:MAG TPA: SET domain-containing protein-lysine N-methyltransferase [Pyrinomonadaceae bacterium]|nr:SET domain-containing protein-lysine N-methyltransferase [Pyrinomonadaceae bacterium]
MKICILDPSYENSDSPMKDYDPLSDVIRHLEGHECETVYIDKAKGVRQIVELSRRDFDVFINLCDGAWDEDRAGIEIVQTLERLGLAFTGATSNFFEPSREVMKKVCHFWGIKAPAYVVASDSQNIELAAQTLRFPLITKHPNSYSSISLTRDSRVETPAALREQAEKMIAAFGSTLIEEFIDGREFSVLVVENADDELKPFAYRPVEFRFPRGESFKHFDLKWKDFEGMTCLQCDDDELAERLEDMSRNLFLGLNGAGYGRCDIRMSELGELFMLEINPNCDVAYPLEEAGSADLILLHEPWGHREFFEKIIGAALKRRQRRHRKWHLLLDGKSRYGMYALEPIEPAELIEAHEEQPHVLVSEKHVRGNWNAEQQSWFAQYAYPLTDEVFVSWSPDPEHWKPINHSCDPNAWLNGLDLVARRKIRASEEITVDYATFYNVRMDDFVCHCNAPDCRKIIRGTDYRESFVERYGEHVSDYIRTKRQAEAAPTDDREEIYQ